MFFPERLDDRTFRLFVQRARQLTLDNQPLSKPEKRLVSLIKQFAELGFLKPGNDFDVNAHYQDDEFNPFEQLAALWQVTRQLDNDQPKGFRNLVNERFSVDAIRSEELYALADIYLTIYKNERENPNFGAIDYLYEVQYLLSNDDEISHFSEESTYAVSEAASSTEIIDPEVVSGMVNDFVQEMYDEENAKPILPEAPIATLLHELPVEWINAMGDFWGIEGALKRDRIEKIATMLQDDESTGRIKAELTDEMNKALDLILQNGGMISYDRLAAEVSDESGDSFWWEDEPPESTLGRLRLMGLVVVGTTKIDGRQQKAVVIPKEARPLIEKVLKL